jgi:hypothetical protein
MVYFIVGMFPDHVLATPHEGSVRSWRMQDMVLAQRDICLIKEGWIEEFPTEIKQFDHVLKRWADLGSTGELRSVAILKSPPPDEMVSEGFRGNESAAHWRRRPCI